MAVIRASAATERIADNGPIAAAGRMTIGNWGLCRIAVPSNLLSVNDFNQLCALTQQQIEEHAEIDVDESIAPLDGESAPERETNAAEIFSRSEALTGPHNEFAPPVVRLVVILESRGNQIIATQRGNQYVMQVLELVFPGAVDIAYPRTRLVMGASNSWAVAAVAARTKSALLRGGGWFTRALCNLLGLRRLTVMGCSGASGAQALEDEVRELLNTGFADLRLIEFNGAMARLGASADKLANERKLRTFRSAFAKCFPGLELAIVDKENWWRPRPELSSAGFERSIDAGDENLVDAAALLQEEQLLIVEQIQARKEPGRARIRLVDEEDGRVAYLRPPLSEALGFTFVTGQRLLCHLKPGQRGEFEVTAARLYEPDDEDLDEVVVVQVERNKFAVEPAVQQDGQEEVYFGNLWLARQAGYRSLAVGTVLRCEIRRVGDVDKVVYIRTHAKQHPLKQRLTLTVETFSRARESYCLGEPKNTKRSASVFLSLAVVEKAGYVALYRGDVVTIDVLNMIETG